MTEEPWYHDEFKRKLCIGWIIAQNLGFLGGIVIANLGHFNLGLALFIASLLSIWASDLLLRGALRTLERD